MRWACLIYDPNGFIDKIITSPEPFAKVFCLKTRSEMIIWAEKHWKEYDHVFLVYDGHWLLDGLGNMSFYAVRYKNDELLNHHTAQLIEENIEEELTEKTASIIFNKIKTIFTRRFLNQ